MLPILLVAGIIILVAAVVLVFGLVNAPDGHEDAQGFHQVKSRADRPRTVWSDEDFGTSHQETHSVKG